MPVGPFVRGLFGPYERQVAEAYRNIFIDLDDWVARLKHWVPQAANILEVGCGEGAMTERLAMHYPDARITAIDITPRLGRLFRGPDERVTFRRVPVETIAAEQPDAYGLVILSDVIHHVPVPARSSLLRAIRTTLAPDGQFIFKEWTRSATPVHWLCEASDRFLTGDDVSYLTADEARGLVNGEFGASCIRESCCVKPWRNNLAFLIDAP